MSCSGGLLCLYNASAGGTAAGVLNAMHACLQQDNTPHPHSPNQANKHATPNDSCTSSHSHQESLWMIHRARHACPPPCAHCHYHSICPGCPNTSHQNMTREPHKKKAVPGCITPHCSVLLPLLLQPVPYNNTQMVTVGGSCCWWQTLFCRHQLQLAPHFPARKSPDTPHTHMHLHPSGRTCTLLSYLVKLHPQPIQQASVMTQHSIIIHGRVALQKGRVRCRTPLENVVRETRRPPMLPGHT